MRCAIIFLVLSVVMMASSSVVFKDDDRFDPKFSGSANKIKSVKLSFPATATVQTGTGQHKEVTNDILDSINVGSLIYVENIPDLRTNAEPYTGTVIVWGLSENFRIACMTLDESGGERTLLFNHNGLFGGLRAVGQQGDPIYVLLSRRFCEELSMKAIMWRDKHKNKS